MRPSAGTRSWERAPCVMHSGRAGRRARQAVLRREGLGRVVGVIVIAAVVVAGRPVCPWSRWVAIVGWGQMGW